MVSVGLRGNYDSGSVHLCSLVLGASVPETVSGMAALEGPV